MSYTGGPQIVNFRPSDEASWSLWAQCAKPGTPGMFPADGDHEGIQTAKAVCEVCPVRAECLTQALSTREKFGVWGGLTTDEREGLRRRDVRIATKSGCVRKTPTQMADSVLGEVA